jgi:hypothetical protein
MKISASWSRSAFAVIAAIILCSTPPASADSYTVFDLGNANDHGIYGIDTAGDTVIWGTTGCGASAFHCYVTYVDGVAVSDGAIAPALAYDNGTACGSTPAGFSSPNAVCNGGWIGLGSLFSPNGVRNGAYTGSGSDLSFLGFGSVDQAFLNSVGDFAWTDGLDEKIYVAVRNSSSLFESGNPSVDQVVALATTPEPGNLVLVATGLIGFTAALCRKTNR